MEFHRMEVKPELENLKGVVCVDICVHGHSVSCEDDGISRKTTERAEITQQLPSVPKIGGTQVDDLL
jgi:hypothetical protein